MKGMSSEVAPPGRGCRGGDVDDAAVAQVFGDGGLGGDGQFDLGGLVTLLIVAAIMKKMSMRKTQSIMGVMSMLASGSSGDRSFIGVQPQRATEVHRDKS
jgi:hypothetical protein